MSNSYSLFGSVSKYNTCAFSISFKKNFVDPQGGFVNVNRDFILHEYFHLVQASSTVFGLWNFYIHIINFLEASNASRRNNDINKFARKFSSWEKMVDQKKLENLETLFFKKIIKPFPQIIHFSGFKKTSYPNLNIENRQYSFPSIRAEFTDVNNRTSFDYELTPLTFYEAYSKCVEDEVNQITFRIPFGNDRLYYYAVRIILNQIFPGISNAQSAVILHWTLNSLEPGSFFKEIIDYLSGKHGTNLPSAQTLSNDIKQDIYLQRKQHHSVCLNLLYDLYQRQRNIGDQVLSNILFDIYNFYYTNFLYITSNLNIPCLLMYPFVLGTNKSLPHINQCMSNNCSLIPLPLYFREEDGHAFTMSGPKFPNYSAVTSLLCIFEMVKKGLLIYGCPIYNNCNLPCKKKNCTKFLYKKKDPCEMIKILQYFQ